MIFVFLAEADAAVKPVLSLFLVFGFDIVPMIG